MKLKEDITLEQLERSYLADSAVREFDRIVARSEKKKRSRRIIGMATGIAIAASVALFFTLVPAKTTSQSAISTVEILQTINQLAAINADRVESITAKPTRKGIIVTAKFNDGKTSKYIMKRDSGTQDIEMVAENINN